MDGGMLRWHVHACRDLCQCIGREGWKVLTCAGAWLEVLQNLLVAMHVPHRIVIGTPRLYTHHH